MGWKLHPRRVADRLVFQSAPENENVGAIQHLASGILEIIAAWIENRDIQGRFHKLQQRIAFDNHVRSFAVV